MQGVKKELVKQYEKNANSCRVNQVLKRGGLMCAQGKC